MSDLISVIIPAWNAERFLRQTVTSVLAQTHTEWEMELVVDPFSTDETARLAGELASHDRRVRVSTATAPGVSEVRNFALRRARGRWISFLDSDDFWLPKKLERQLAAMKHTGAAFSCTAFRRVSEDGRRTGRALRVPERITRRRLLQGNCILCSSVMLDREAFHQAPRFQEVGCEDFALWLQLLRERDCLGVTEDLVRYRRVRGSRGASKWRSLHETWCIYRKLEKQSPLRAGGLMLPFLAHGLLKYARF